MNDAKNQQLPGFDEVWERIRSATGWKNQLDLARTLGLTGSSVTDAKKRGTFPLNWAFQVAETRGLSLDHLLRGHLPTTSPSACTEYEEPSGVRVDGVELILVPKVRARLSAGFGSLETEDEIIGRYAFRHDWIRSKGTPGRMVLMDISGESMEPLMYGGDTALIDLGQTEIIAGSIFAVGIGDEVVVKFVDKLPGRLVLRSKNPDYPPVDVPMTGDLAEGVRIIGRVLWWCREAR